MLIGQQVGKVGPKKRVSVPAKFRTELGNKLVVSKGFEGCLILLSRQGFKKMIEEALAGPITEDKIREEARFLLAAAEEVVLDKQGRFVMPAHLAEYASLSNEVYFIGLMRWVEIWDKTTWEKQNNLKKSKRMGGR